MIFYQSPVAIPLLEFPIDTGIRIRLSTWQYQKGTKGGAGLGAADYNKDLIIQSQMATHKSSI